MALYPAGIHIQIRLSGGMGPDRWSTGYWLRFDSSITIPTPVQANAYALNVLTDFNTRVWNAATTGLKIQNVPDTTLDTCQANVYNGSTFAVQGIGTQTPVPGTGTNAHPGYTALCVTLQSAFPGRSNRGRMYLPATSIGILGSTLQLSSTTIQDGIVTNLAAHLASSALSPSWGSPASFTPVVLSKLLGTTADVINLRMDSIPDTQHGRTRALVAAHTSTHTVP